MLKPWYRLYQSLHKLIETHLTEWRTLSKQQDVQDMVKAGRMLLTAGGTAGLRSLDAPGRLDITGTTRSPPYIAD